MICAYTKPGEVVLDCFSESGSTALAALKTSRSFIGCEVNTENYIKSLERLELHKSDNDVIFQKIFF